MKIVLNIILLSSISSLYASSAPVVESFMRPKQAVSRAAEVTSPLPSPEFPFVFTQSQDSEGGPIVFIERAEEKETAKMQRKKSGGGNFFPGNLHSYTVTAAGGCCLVLRARLDAKKTISFIERTVLYDATGKILKDESIMNLPVEDFEQPA